LNALNLGFFWCAVLGFFFIVYDMAFCFLFQMSAAIISCNLISTVFRDQQSVVIFAFGCTFGFFIETTLFRLFLCANLTRVTNIDKCMQNYRLVLQIVMSLISC